MCREAWWGCVSGCDTAGGVEGAKMGRGCDLGGPGVTDCCGMGGRDRRWRFEVDGSGPVGSPSGYGSGDAHRLSWVGALDTGYSLWNFS